MEPIQTQPQRYRKLSTLAVVSVVFAAFSLLSAVGWLFAVVPALGIASALWSLKRINQMPEELTGRRLALVGLWLSAVVWAAGSGILLFAEGREVPRGYQAVSFADLQPDSREPDQLIPPKALELVGEDPLTGQDRRIFIQGYMYPSRRTIGIKEFILVPTLGHCSFCSSQMKSTEMIRVRLTGDLSARYKSTRTGVGGKLEIDPVQALNPLGGLPYQLEADYIR